MSLKLIFSTAGAAGFLAAAVIIAIAARSHQLSGTMMSNGKGGAMSPSDGYLLSATLFVMGLGYAFWVWKLLRPSKSQKSDVEKRKTSIFD
jgi:hypothetical protein